MENIKPQELGVGIKRINNTSKGATIVAESKEAIEKLHQEINDRFKETLISKPLKSNYPKIIIYNLDDDQTNYKIVDILLNQNAEIRDALNDKKNSLKIIFSMKSKRPNKKHLVIEVSPKIRNIIAQNYYQLSFNWSILNCSDFISIKRCFNCYGFRHSKKFCTEKKNCIKCNTENENENSAEENECLNCTSVDDENNNVNNNKCIVCTRAIKNNKNLENILNVDHHTLDKDCPSYKRQLELEKINTNYNENE